MLTSDYITNKIKNEKVNKFFERYISKKYTNNTVLMNDLINNVFNKNIENQFSLYGNSNEAGSYEYLLYYGKSNINYYFCWTTMYNKSEDFIIYDIFELPIKHIIEIVSNRQFIYSSSGVTQLYYKNNKIDFLKLFNENKVRFYNDEEY